MAIFQELLEEKKKNVFSDRRTLIVFTHRIDPKGNYHMSQHVKSQMQCQEEKKSMCHSKKTSITAFIEHYSMLGIL